MNCRNNLATKILEAKTIKTIWEWADHLAFFLAETNHLANTSVEEAAFPMKPLDLVCILLSRLATQGQVDRIRQRLLLYFLAWIVQEKIQAVGIQDDVIALLVQSQLISEASRECATKSLNEWLRAGNISVWPKDWAGPGALILLPLWGESTWYHRRHVGGNDMDELIALLKARGLMRDANQKRHDNRNAFVVVHRLFEALLVRSNLRFVHYETILPSRPVSKRIRSSHLQERRRREQSAAIPSSPPAIDQRAAAGLSSRHLTETDPLSSYDVFKHCTHEPLDSTSICFLPMTIAATTARSCLFPQ